MKYIRTLFTKTKKATFDDLRRRLVNTGYFVQGFVLKQEKWMKMRKGVALIYGTTFIILFIISCNMQWITKITLLYFLFHILPIQGNIEEFHIAMIDWPTSFEDESNISQTLFTGVQMHTG